MSLAERDNDQLVSRAPRDLCCAIGCTNEVRASGQGYCDAHHAERQRIFRAKKAKADERLTILEMKVVQLSSELRRLQRIIESSRTAV